jgi:hypothetical protein
MDEKIFRERTEKLAKFSNDIRAKLAKDLDDRFLQFKGVSDLLCDLEQCHKIFGAKMIFPFHLINGEKVVESLDILGCPKEEHIQK